MPTFLVGEHDDAAKRRATYRRERDLVANSTTEHLVSVLGASDDEIRRVAARDELLRRREAVGCGGESSARCQVMGHAVRMDRDHDAVWATICDHPPVGHMLEAYAPDRWLRFHSLPEGRRYPETPDDADELLYRADVLVGQLCQPGDDLMLITGLYGRRGAPPPEPSSAQQLVQPDARYWCTVDATRDTDDDAVWPLHLWVGWRGYAPRALDTVVRLVADDELAAVIVVAPDRLVAVHPYHGGVDMLFPTTEERDTVRQRYAKWISSRDGPLPPMEGPRR